jgi:hypothetical protein
MKQKILLYYDMDNLEEFCNEFRKNYSKLNITKDNYKNTNNFVYNLLLKDTAKIFLYIMKDHKKRKKYIKALFIKDDNIKSLIATYCLRYGIYRTKSRRILKSLIKKEKDIMLKKYYEMSLKEYGFFYKNNFEIED